MKVNLFKSVKDSSPSLTRNVAFFLDRIRNGNSKDIIQRIRSTEDKTEIANLKRKLPAVTFNATFSVRNKQSVKDVSGLMTLDFDEFVSTKDAFLFKDKLKKDEHIFAAWISPSFGVKALYRIADVKDDNDFKKIYSEVIKIYPNLDQSGKDISRLCFESYDPEIYVNLEAEVFSPTIVLDKEVNNIGTATNTPIVDEDAIVNRLIVWFERDILDTTKLNNSIYILASAFNSFGVSKQKATTYGFRYAKPEAPKKEVTSIINSAYKNEANFNTKSFEDEKAKEKLNTMVASGKDDKDILKAFSHLPSEKIKDAIECARNSVIPDVFWEYNSKGEPKIKPYNFKVFLESKDYLKYYPDDGSNAFIFIKKDDNFLEIVSEYQIKDFVLNNLEERFEIDIYNIMAEKTKAFTFQYLSILNTANVQTVRDGEDFAMLYYRNTAVKVEKEQITEISYNDLDGYVWKNNIIDREYKDVDHHQSQFRSFVWYISGQDQERYNTFKSLIGYLLHSYKNSANNKAIILNDEKISDNPNGGSGKGILTTAIGKMKNLSVIDGKNFDFGKSFLYQTVSTDTQVLSFDDIRQNFKFEQLFSLITEGITLEYKGKDAIKLSVEDSPKIIISTNYTIRAEGGSFERRMFEVELSSYFNNNFSPRDHFGNMLFDGWCENEWNLFDKFMINCIQYYLENGLVAYDHVNLEIRKLINSTSQEFIDFMNDEELFSGLRVDYKSLKEKFEHDYNDYREHRWFNQKLFNKWLSLYFEYKEFDYKSISSNGLRTYELKSRNETNIINTEKEDYNNEIPF